MEVEGRRRRDKIGISHNSFKHIVFFQKGRPTTPAQMQYGRQQYLVDNETINKQLKLKEYNRGTGKR